ncbi:hypothetical protein F5Y14DRAFT_160487 [Nemania sp. NC0429]|nr:hypothetical protein F5Y14DRAFT_160487 [Nemania sp. NC0429]
MVSFFGLKIGGEKKKKSSKDLISAPQLQNPGDPNAIDGNFFDFKGGLSSSYEASVYSLSRQDSRQSTASIASKFKKLKAVSFASNKFGSSMTDLPIPPGLNHHASNPSIGRRWNTGSSTSLNLAPPSFNPLARPSTSDGRKKPWVNPLDVHFTRDSAKAGFKAPLSPALSMRDDTVPMTPLSAAPKSPLGQYELKLDLPSDVSSFADLGSFGETVLPPAPLRIKKPASPRPAAEPRTESRPHQKPPSPPQSIGDRETLESSVLEPPKLPTAEMRPSSAQSQRSIPSRPPGLGGFQNATADFGPASLPSPSTTPRASEEQSSVTSTSSRPVSPPAKRGSAKPVIRNVRAKRDTLTINPQRRRSLQMKIEASESGNIPSLLPIIDKPKASNSGRQLERPPPLTLNTGFRQSVTDHDGPRSAPFLNPNPSFTPKSMRSPLRLQVSVQRDPTRSAFVNKTGNAQPGTDSPTGSSVYDDDDDVYNHSPSTESTSPVIPLTGPLASPRFPPSSQSPYSFPSAFTLPQRDETETDRSLSPSTPPVPPRSLRRNPPTPDSSYWPLPSPVVPSSDRAATTPSPADSRLRSESESGSLTAYEPFSPPRIPAARSGAESPTFRSFSRPWTPTATGEFTAPSLKRAETAKPLSRLGMGGEFGGGLRPPPRSATVKAPRTEAGTLEGPGAGLGEGGLGSRFI